ncbi:MAG: choice-of-anchor D domain-containing protein [Thermodesulfobacteriota bacterium]
MSPNPGQLIAQVYADGLYELASKFWPGGEYPRLEELRYVDAGQILSTGWDIDPTDLMHTYIGGLPNCERYYFNAYLTESYETYCGHNYWSCYPHLVFLAIQDAYTRARNKCPVWPPGIALDSEGNQTMESVEFALEYLGWALHMIQDLTIPYHATNRATSSHSDWENSISALVRGGHFDHLPLVDLHSCYAGPPPHDPDSIYYYAEAVSVRDFAESIKQSSIDCSDSLGYTDNLKEVLLDLAIKATAAVIEKFFKDVGPFFDDLFEDNDSYYQVEMLSPGRHQNLTVFPDDEDWYRFHVSEDYSDIVIDVIYDFPLADEWIYPWLIVHRAIGDDVIGGIKIGNSKRIVLNGANAGYYELKVESDFPLQYELIVSVTRGSLPEDEFERWGGNDTPETASEISDLRYYDSACYDGLNIDRPGDDDHYLYTLAEGNWRVMASASFDPEHGGISLFLEDREALIGVLRPDGTKLLRVSKCISDGSALVRVSGARNYYSLCVEKTPDPACGNFPVAEVAPSSILFGTQTVGTSSRWEIVRISNQGSADLQISEVALSDTVNFELNVNLGADPCGTLTPSLSPQQSCTVGLRFKPQSVSKFHGTLNIGSNDPVSPSKSIPVSGAGAHIRISADPQWLYKCDGRQTFTISSAVSPYFVDWMICEQTTTPWGAPGPVLCSYDWDLPENFQVQYEQNTVVLDVNGCVPQWVLSLGLRVRDSRGVFGIKDIEIVIPEPDIAVSSTDIDFGDVTVGSYTTGWPTVVRTLTVLNTGTGPLQINASLIASPELDDMTLRNHCPDQIEPGGTCAIEAVFRPTIEGEARATLRIVSDDPDEPEVSVTLHGKGVRRPKINTMVFGEPLEAAVGGTNYLRVNVWNTGSGPLEIHTVELDETTDFSLSLNACQGVLPYNETNPGACYVMVAFSPTRPGALSTTLSIKSNDPTSPRLRIPLSGTGTDGFITVTDTSLDFKEAGKRLCFDIQNTSPSATLSWDLSSQMPSWLRASETSGTLNPGTKKSICLFAQRAGLGVDQTYSHSLAITSNGGDIAIAVSMTVPLPLGSFAKYYGGEAGEYFSKIRPTSDGGFIAAGLTNSFGAGPIGPSEDAWVVKMDASGYVEWSRTYGGHRYPERAYDVKKTSDGGFILIAGTRGFTSEGQYGLWILKLDPYGDIEWQKVYETPGSDDNWGDWGKEFSIEEVQGGYVVAGNVRKDWDQQELRLWVLKLDMAGEILWEKTYGGAGDSYGNSIRATSDGGYIIAGVERSPAENWPASKEDPGGPPEQAPNWDMWVVKLGVDGRLQWEKRYGTEFDDYAYDLQETSDGGFILVGTTLSTSSAWVLKLDGLGNIQWQKAYGRYDGDYYGGYGHSIKETADDGYVLAGVLTSRTSGDDVWVVKLDHSGDVQWEKTYGGNGIDVAYWIDTTPDGGYVLAGYSTSFRSEPGSRQYDAFVLKLDSIGDIGGCGIVSQVSTHASETDIEPVDTHAITEITDTGVFDTDASIASQAADEIQGTICADSDYTLTVKKAGSGEGMITSDPAGISCGEDCQEAYPLNTSVVLTASPAEGSSFAGWSGNCTDIGDGLARVTMNSDKTCTATFTTLSGPDLVGSWRRSKLVGNFLIRGSLRITNLGTERTGTGFRVSFYLSEDEIPDSSDTFLDSSFVRKVIKPGGKKTIPFIYVSKRSLGGKYLIAIVDALDQIQETDELNNVVIEGPLRPGKRGVI